MNVGELRAQLDDLPDDMEILIASDEEGNRFHPLAEVAGGFIDKDDSGYSIDGLADADDVLDDDGGYDESIYEERVILWP